MVQKEKDAFNMLHAAKEVGDLYASLLISGLRAVACEFVLYSSYTIAAAECSI